MDARQDIYWSVEACAWVASPQPPDVPSQRPAAQPEGVVDLRDVDLRDADLLEADLPTGAPV